MLYLITTKLPPETVLPPPENVVPGFDRLSWESPYPGTYDKIVGYINSGDLPRYTGPYDSIVKTDTEVTSTIALLTEAGANSWKDWTLTIPGVTSCEITTIPQEGDPGYVAP